LPQKPRQDAEVDGRVSALDINKERNQSRAEGGYVTGGSEQIRNVVLGGAQRHSANLGGVDKALPRCGMVQ
jgi:hypothetical protein